MKKVFECAMIGVDNHLRAQEIELKFLNGKYNRKELLLSGYIILLGLIECLASIIDNIRLLVSSLPQNCPNRTISVTHYFEWKSPIGLLNNGSGNESLFNPQIGRPWLQFHLGRALLVFLRGPHLQIKNLPRMVLRGKSGAIKNMSINLLFIFRLHLNPFIKGTQ